MAHADSNPRLQRLFDLSHATYHPTDLNAALRFMDANRDTVLAAKQEIDLLVGRADMHPLEGLGHMDTAKALPLRFTVLREAASDVTLPEFRTGAASDPAKIFRYLTSAMDRRAILSFHLLDQGLRVWAATNYPIPGGAGVETTYYSVAKVDNTKALTDAVAEFSETLDGGSPDFALIERPLDLIGSLAGRLLGGTWPEELVLVPDAFLHLVPMHMAPVMPNHGVRLVDVVPCIRYGSSIREFISSTEPARPTVIDYASVSESPATDDDSYLAWLPAAPASDAVAWSELAASYRCALGPGARALPVSSPADVNGTVRTRDWIDIALATRSAANSWSGTGLFCGHEWIGAEDLLRNWTFQHRVTVVLADNVSLLAPGGDPDRSEYTGLDLLLRLCGAGAVLATNWRPSPTVSLFTAMVTCSQSLRQSTPVALLNGVVQRAMKSGDWKRVLLSERQLEALPEDFAQHLDAAQSALRDLPEGAFADDASWAAYRCFG